MKRALIIGIDDYSDNPLNGCVNDASAIASILATNADGSPNFDVRQLTSDKLAITTAVMSTAITDLFSPASGTIDTALFFFAGHGIIEPTSGEGFIVSVDGRKPSWGISLSTILRQAQAAQKHIDATVIILDSCQSGFAGEIPSLGISEISAIGNGVTILTAAHREGTAEEFGGHGLFTGLLLDGMNGSASDIMGNVTPAALYALIDQTLGSWQQRPIYKANVSTFVKLRQLPPKVPLDVLRRLPKYFPQGSDEFKLDPQYEPDRKNVPERFRNLPLDEAKNKVFKELQTCNRQGLVIPVAAEHMYDAAINSKSCKLTAIGAHYRKLAEAGRI